MKNITDDLEIFQGFEIPTKISHYSSALSWGDNWDNLDMDDSNLISPKPQNKNTRLHVADLKKLDLEDQENIKIITNFYKYDKNFKEGKRQGSTYASTGNSILRTNFPANWAEAKKLGFQLGQIEYTKNHDPNAEDQQEARGRTAASVDLAKGRTAKTNKPSAWSKAQWAAYKNYVKEHAAKFNDSEFQQQKAAQVANARVNYYRRNREKIVAQSSLRYYELKKTKKRKINQISENPNEFFNANKKPRWEISNKDPNGRKLTLRRTR